MATSVHETETAVQVVVIRFTEITTLLLLATTSAASVSNENDAGGRDTSFAISRLRQRNIKYQLFQQKIV